MSLNNKTMNLKQKSNTVMQEQKINMYALEKEMIYSGETQQFEKMGVEWDKILAMLKEFDGEDQKFSIEEVGGKTQQFENGQQYEEIELEWGKKVEGFQQKFSIKEALGYETAVVNKLVEEFQQIPVWRYVINYLFICLGFTYEEKNRKAMFEDIENKEITKNPNYEKRSLPQDLFDYLVKEVQKRFIKNKLPEKFCKEKYIRAMILDLNEKMLLESMALGLDMTVEMINIFLTKVLKRAELDYYNSDEFLLLVVLQNEADAVISHYEQYLKLKEYYDTIEVSSVDNKIQIDITRSISDHVSKDYIKANQLFKGKECTKESIDSGLDSMLRYHHLIRKPSRRTSEKVFLQLLENTQKLYHNEIIRYKESSKEDSKLLNLRKYGAGNLQIRYEPNREIRLEKGTRFYRKKDERAADEEENRIWFVLEEETVLLAKNTVTLSVSVQSITKMDKVEKSKKRYIKNGSKLQLKIDNKKIISVKAEKALNYYMIEEDQEKTQEKDQGKIEIECEPGTFIEKNTFFVYIENGNRYEFVSKENQRADSYISDDIMVYCKSFDKKNDELEDENQLKNYLVRIGKPVKDKKNKTKELETKYYEIASTGTVRYMEYHVEGIIGVENLKPINYQEKEKGQGEDLKEKNFLGFTQYLYPSDFIDYDEEILSKIDVNLFGKWFTSTEITAYAYQNFSKKKDIEKRNYLLTLVFLSFVKKIEDKEYKSQDIRRWFEEEADDIMEECRLQKLYMGNLYDRLLIFLLLHALPVEAFRQIWLVVKTKGGNIK